MKAKVSCLLANGVGTENSVIIKNEDTRQIYQNLSRALRQISKPYHSQLLIRV